MSATRRWWELLAQANSDGTALTAAAAASALPTHAVWTMPPNFLEVGSQLRVRASGRISNVVTTPGTARYDVRLGAVVAFDGLALPLNIVAKTSVGWWLELLLTCRSIGSGTSATLMGQGFWTSESVIGSPLPSVGGGGTIILPYNSAPAVGAGFDSTVSNAVNLYFTQTVATGSMTLHQYSLAMAT